MKLLEDPHIVKVITAYKHGDAFNLVFPLAKTDLGQYIRDRQYRAVAESTRCSLELHPFWEQMLGVARALNRITHGVPDVAGSNKSYGYHFDLKPANILVEDEEDGVKFMISDFGQAMFRDFGGTSKVTGMGGTEAYAPPEIDDRSAKMNRKYDVWSLGCILAEVCAFVVGGYDGVQEFDDLKASANRDCKFVDDRFWQTTRGLSVCQYELKPQILNWLDRLPSSPLVRNARSHDFLLEIVVLTKQMLSVDIHERLTSVAVHITLSGILERYRSTRSNSFCSFSPGVDLRSEEVELGKELLGQMRPASCFKEGRWHEGRIKVVEDSSKKLTVLLSQPGSSEQLEIGPRAEARIIPYNTSQAPDMLSILQETKHAPRQPINVYLNDPMDTITLQSVLLGQNIRRLGHKTKASLDICSASFERRSSGLRNAFASSKSKPVASDLGQASAIQLWSEQSYEDPKAWRPKDFSRPTRDISFRGPALRRMVIYYPKAILILRLVRGARVEKPEERSNCRRLKIIPTDKIKDSTFAASLLSCRTQEDVPSISLDRAQLDEEERNGIFECKSVEINFQTPDDLGLFYKSYILMKQEWRDEAHQIEMVKDQMGEQLGWALLY